MTFTCCSDLSDNTMVTNHSLGMRGDKGVTYELWVSSTDADGNEATAGPFYHTN